MQEEQARKPAAALGLMAVGGALCVIGAFMAWARVEASGFSVSSKGTDGTDGWVALACGVLLVLLGVGTWAVSSKGARRGLGILALLAGLAAGGLGTWDAVSAEDSFVDALSEQLSDQFGLPTAEVETQVRQALDAGELSISLQAGIYLVIAGGALGLLGGFAGMSSRVPAPAAGAPGAAPPSGWVAPPEPSAPPSEETPPAEG